jgi:hypothetical protein
MLAEIRQFDSEVMRFQQEIIFAQEKMKSIAQNIRAQIALLKDVQIVQSYGASRSLGMNAANESGSSASVKRQLIGSNEESKPSAEEETALRKGERKKKNTTRQMLTGVGVLAIMGLALMAFSLQSLQLPIGSASVNTAVTNSNRSSSSDTQEPVDVVASYMQAFAGQQFDKMKSLACPENDNFVKSIDFGSQLAETLQVDRSTIIDAIDIRMSNMTYKEFVRRDTSASVSVKGHFDLVIDREKMRVVIEMASKAKQNTDWDQSKINEVTDNIIKNFASGQDFNATSDLVLRDGKWLICE